MKKSLTLFALAAILFTAALSCSKETDDPTQNQPQEQTEEPAVTPEQPADLPEGMIQLTFSVNPEETKTSWDGTTHGWSEGDQVRILWGEGESDFVDAAVENGQVTAVVDDVDTYYAVYPTTATYALDLAAGKVTVTIPRFQTGNFADANIMAAKTTKEALSLEFKNMTSILKVSTGSTYDYNTIAVMANDQTKLTGTVSTTFPETFAVETANGSEAILSLQKGNPSGFAGVSASNTYYLAMLPGAAIEKGIGFKIEQRMGSTVLLGGGISKSAFARERSQIYDLGTLDNRIVRDWYISETGTGVGNTESAPAGPDRLIDLLNPSYSLNGTTAGWRLAGATIHVLPGTYNLQELNGGEVLAPHYNLSNLVAHVKGEGTEANPTKFICNQTADNDHIFAVTEAHKVGDFTFENITFTANPAASNSNASGIAFNYSSTNTDNIITFKKCTFSDFISTATEGIYGGGAVFVNINKKNALSFEECSFLRCNAIRGGAVALNNTDAESTAIFKDCIFKNNVASTTSGIGGCVYLYAKAHAHFNHTSFTGSEDGEIQNAQHGGALGIVANASVTLENNCSFTQLTSGQKGGAVFNHGSLEASDITFTACKSKSTAYDTSAGTIYTDGTVNIVDAVFSNNTSNTGSVIYADGASGKIGTTTIFNSLFEGNETTATDGSGSSQKGCTVFAFKYCNVLLANCTLRNNTEHNASHGVVSPRNNNAYIYLVSCTMSENLISDGTTTSPGKDIARTTSLITAHNTIATNTPGDILNVVRDYSIFTLRRFIQSKSDYTDMTAFSLKAYDPKGVYPLDSTYETDYNGGMSVEQLQALTFDNITLTDEQKALLAKDQKGNDRTGTIMGAYVKTE